MNNQNNTTPFAFNPQGANQGNRDAWKADAFINIYIPMADGSTPKLGSIGLKLDRKGHNQVIQALSNDPNLVKQLLGQMNVDFRLAEVGGTEAALGFDLVADDAPAKEV